MRRSLCTAFAPQKNISRKEHPHRDLSTTLRSGRDDKGEGGASGESSCWIRAARSAAGTVIALGTNIGFCSATTIPGSAPLPFVISTGAQRSGEICGFPGWYETSPRRAIRVRQRLSPEAPLSPLSSRPDRSAVERSAFFPVGTRLHQGAPSAFSNDYPRKRPSPLCHLDRSAAQWRDLRFSRLVRNFTKARHPRSATTIPGSAPLPFVISTAAQRSGEICVFPGWYETSPRRAIRVRQRLSPEAPLSPLSSRPERRAVERSAFFPVGTKLHQGAPSAFGNDYPRKRPSPLCHLDRSAAQWRDLRFSRLVRDFTKARHPRSATTIPGSAPLRFVISTGVQRSGEICVFPGWYETSPRRAIRFHPGRSGGTCGFTYQPTTALFLPAPWPRTSPQHHQSFLLTLREQPHTPAAPAA